MGTAVPGTLGLQSCERKFFLSNSFKAKFEMRFSLRRLEKEHALPILRWRYLPPYDIYNFDIDTIQEDLCYLIDLKNAFYAILNVYEELEGYCSFGADGQVPGGDYSTEALDIGMGM
ncbi:hypothetical protein ACQ4N7_06760 [Nodosilinea sp. AN01ver1]|uniref:hypothetical protein n=1 Tax=Nodosilinea sp. AN01ver1 TaxID=3423362 RepID=UPI003D31E275